HRHETADKEEERDGDEIEDTNPLMIQCEQPRLQPVTGVQVVFSRHCFRSLCSLVHGTHCFAPGGFCCSGLGLGCPPAGGIGISLLPGLVTSIPFWIFSRFTGGSGWALVIVCWSWPALSSDLMYSTTWISSSSLSCP